jgi:hypothetical protein
MTEPFLRPEWACVLHAPPRRTGAWARADQSYRTCSSCLDNLRDRLKEIAIRWVRLSPAPGAQGESGGRGAPGYGSRSPGSDHVIAMRDRRSSREARVWVARDGRVHAETERPPLSVHAELAQFAGFIVEARQVACGARSVPELVRWLDAQLDWVTRREGVLDLDRVLRDLIAQLRPVTGEPGRRRIGTCPNTVAGDTEHPRECGAVLYAPLKDDTIRCTACARVWTRDQWLELGQLLQVAS